MKIWQKLIRKLELFFKQIMCCNRRKNFFCDSWTPPWPCVTCKRIRHFLKFRHIPGMMFLATVKKGTHSFPKCWFWQKGDIPINRTTLRQIGMHFYSAFTQGPFHIFKSQYERAFFGFELSKIKLPPPPEIIV